MTAAIDFKTRPIGSERRGQVIDEVPADAVWGQRVAVSMRHQEPEGGNDRQEVAQIPSGAGAGTPAAPVPMPVHILVEQLIGKLGGKMQLLTGVARKGCAIGARVAVKDRIGTAVARTGGERLTAAMAKVASAALGTFSAMLIASEMTRAP